MRCTGEVKTGRGKEQVQADVLSLTLIRYELTVESFDQVHQ